MEILIPRIQSITVRREGAEVLMFDRHGHLLLRLPWETALRVGTAVIQQARRIEEIIKREQVVFDQAILVRLGVPIGLINDPSLRIEAMKEAAWNSDLRRYIPGGVRSQEAIGAPTVVRHQKKEAPHE